MGNPQNWFRAPVVCFYSVRNPRSTLFSWCGSTKTILRFLLSTVEETGLRSPHIQSLISNNVAGVDGRHKPGDRVESLGSPLFCVVLHDVAAPFRLQVQQIVTQVFDFIGSRFACGVVPLWHGDRDEDGMAELISICGDCEEWMIHGVTHHRERGGRLVSWLTNGSDEFGGLQLAAIQKRVATSQAMIHDLTGILPTGLVAPCWSLPVSPNELSGIDFVMGYTRLMPCCRSEEQLPADNIRLASWSYDWGRFGKVASLVNMFPELRSRIFTGIVPCVVIHPEDVVRGWLPVAIQKIEKLLNLGYQPVVPSKLMSVAEASAS